MQLRLCAIVVLTHGLAEAARVVRVTDEEGGASAHLPLCDPAVVSEACDVLDIENHTSIDVLEIKEALSSTHDAAVRLWASLGIPGQSASCLDFCKTLVKALESRKWRVPATTDAACYEDDDGSTRCDLDLSPEALGRDIHSDEDLPDFHAGYGHNQSHTHHGPTYQADEGLDYTQDELIMRVANVFRIYPDSPMSFNEVGEENDDGDVEVGVAAASLAQKLRSKRGDWQRQLRKVSVKAQASVSQAIRKLSKGTTRKHLQTWFGDDLRASDLKHIRMVLNSVDRMLGNVDYIYPGEDCTRNTYAYVYPESRMSCSERQLRNGAACTKNNKGQFIFYMCPLTMKSKESVQIETLTHEGSHHATAFTDDVDFEGETAYGRSTCKKLAKYEPDHALENADNYCYFIQDLFAEGR